MSGLSPEALERLRVVLVACLDGERQIGQVRVLDPSTGKRKYLGDLAEELLQDLPTEAA